MLSCDICSENFSIKCNLVRHVRSCHQKTTYQCSKCDKKFTRQDAVRRHLKASHGRIKEENDRCQHSKQRNTAQQKPVEAASLPVWTAEPTEYITGDRETFSCDTELHSCTLCPVRFATAGELAGHVRICHEKVSYACSRCTKTFALADDLQQHMKYHEWFHSEAVGYSTNQGTQFQSHVQIKEEKDVEELPNHGNQLEQQPLETFVRTAEPTEQLTEVKEEPSCDAQKPSLSNSPVRFQNIGVRTSNQNISYDCSYCQKKFKKENDLKRHLKSHNWERQIEALRQRTAQVNQVQSQVCVKEENEACQLPDQGKPLQQHQPLEVASSPTQNAQLREQVTGDEEKPSCDTEINSCKICAARFTTDNELAGHVRTHHENMSYACPTSPKQEIKSQIAENENPNCDGSMHSCGSCPARFSLFSSLKRHLQSCHRKTPRQCPKCDSRFDREDALKRHMKVHQRIRLYQPPKQVNHLQLNHMVGVLTPMRCTNQSQQLVDAVASLARTTEPREQVTGDSCDTKVHSCEFCPALFTTDGELAGHVRIYHTYSCSRCPKKFNRKAHLTQHMNYHAWMIQLEITRHRPQQGNQLQFQIVQKEQRSFERKMHSCGLCPARFSMSNNLKRHLRTCHRKSPLACPKCPSKFNRRDALQRHLKSQHQGGAPCVPLPVLNAETRREVADPQVAKIHRESAPAQSSREPITFQNEKSSSETIRNTCKFCSSKSSKIRDLLYHFQHCRKNFPYECSECYKKFERQDALQQHMEIHKRIRHLQECATSRRQTESTSESRQPETVLLEPVVSSTNEQPPEPPRRTKRKRRIYPLRFSCETCSKLYRSRAEVSYHQRSHTGEKPYACTMCPKKFRLRHTLNNHTRNVHSGARHACQVCHKTYSSLQQVRNHLKTHSEQRREYECSLCPKRYISNTGLLEHLRMHTGEKPYECDLCHKAFANKHRMRIHQKIHGGVRDQICKLCGKGFKTRTGLEHHRFVHATDKNYLCEECGKIFSRLETLRRHMLVHTGERTHVCEECGQGFGQSGTLRRHMLVHTGEKPHKCDICDRAFSQRSMLDGHMRTHKK